MNGLPYYKAYPRDFIEGTIGMPFELKATYRLVLDLIYMQGGELPDDVRYISGLLGCSVRMWKKNRELLISSGKIFAENGIISNFRASLELESLAKVQEKQRENRSRPNKNNDLASPRFDHTEPDTDTEPDKKDISPKSPCFESEFSETFWPQYPLKKSKGGSLKAFKSARKRFELSDIMAGVHRYAAERDGQDHQFTKHASSWLNQQCWLDEPDPPPKPSNRTKEDNFGNAVSELNRRLNGHEPSHFDRCETQASQGVADEFNTPTIEGTSNRVFGPA